MGGGRVASGARGAARRWVAAFACLFVAAAGAAQPASYVFDHAGVLSVADAQALSVRLAKMDRETTVQIAIVTLSALEGVPMDSASLALAREIGPGQRGVNNGALILLAMAEREVRIEIGTGLEWQVSDSLAATIVAEMLPVFRQGAFARGLRLGVDAIAARARSVPWDVTFASAAEASGEHALGRIAEVTGVVDGDHLCTGRGRVRLLLPPHWASAQGALRQGERLRVVGRVASVAPLTLHVLGRADEASGARGVAPRERF